MSLSAFLLQSTHKSTDAIDKGLDDLFRAPAPLKSGTSLSSEVLKNPGVSSNKKRKAAGETHNQDSKRSKSEQQTKPKKLAKPQITSKHGHRASFVDATSSRVEGMSSEAEAEVVVREEGRERPSKQNLEASSSEDEDDNDDPSRLVHETLQTSTATKAKGQSRHGKSQYVPPDESAEQRDARTVFVGNVTVEVIKSRPTQKQFKRHILSFVPAAKIESVRFRSIAFSKPTSELPSTDETSTNQKRRERDRERTSAWRGEDKDESAAVPTKRFLTPKEKKRVAYIKHEIHDLVDAVNAYIVFAYPPTAGSHVTEPSDIAHMDPFKAARCCAEKCDGSVFMERTLRVDVAKRGVKSDAGGGGEVMGDPKATVFVGNLDFASKEEDLRIFFESLLCAERGQPEEQDGDDDDELDEEALDENNVKKPRAWVKRVRIIRDKDTQVGKGFAYVQFVDRGCTDEILALDESKLKFAKRKLRVQRCKTLPGGPKFHAARPSGAPPSSHPKSSSSRPAPAHRLVPVMKQMPRGDPELGTKLAHLPKEERKKVKATDADRVARRLAKKRAKALADKGVKARADKPRVRQRTNEKKAAGQRKDSLKAKKRVRSGTALSKMNTKK